MIATQPVSAKLKFYSEVMQKTVQIFGFKDPVTLMRDTAALVIDFNMRQQHSDPLEVNLDKIWELRQNFSRIGILKLDEREKTKGSFKSLWRQIRLERDLSRETLDCATLLRTIYSRHGRAKDLSPFWFLFPDDLRLYKIFKHQDLVEFTKAQADLIQASALRSAPPESLIATINHLAKLKDTPPEQAPKARAIALNVIAEMRRRVIASGKDAGTKPAFRKANNGGVPVVLIATELKYAQELSQKLPALSQNQLWIIGGERYLQTNPLTAAKQRALRPLKTPDQQGLLGFAVNQEGKKIQASKQRQERGPKGRWRTDLPTSPVRALGGRASR